MVLQDYLGLLISFVQRKNLDVFSYVYILGKSHVRRSHFNLSFFIDIFDKIPSMEQK